MSEERPYAKCDQCGHECASCHVCGKSCCSSCGHHYDFKKKKECNLCKCVNVSNEVTLGTVGGFTICGCVTDVADDSTSLKLAAGAVIKGPELDSPVCTDRVTTICCDSIVWIY